MLAGGQAVQPAKKKMFRGVELTPMVRMMVMIDDGDDDDDYGGGDGDGDYTCGNLRLGFFGYSAPRRAAAVVPVGDDTKDTAGLSIGSLSANEKRRVTCSCLPLFTPLAN